MGGGVTPVHTTLVPDISTIVRNGLQENINPSLNILRDTSAGNGIGPNKDLGGSNGFAGLHPFTMGTLDPYVFSPPFMSSILMFLKQYSHAALGQNRCSKANAPTESSIAESSKSFKLGVQFTSSSFLVNITKPNLPSSGYGSTLSALLSGKHNVPYSSTSSTSYPTPLTSPVLHPKGGASLPVPLLYFSQTSSATVNQCSSLSSSQKDQQHAMLAAIASQTILCKLGSAFWDAFTGSSSVSSSSLLPRGDWDADKVRKILEGKAVLLLQLHRGFISGLPLLMLLRLRLVVKHQHTIHLKGALAVLLLLVVQCQLVTIRSSVPSLLL